MGPFPSLFGNLYILLAVDYVSKWVEAIAYPRNDASTVVGFIQRNILSKFGTPRTIISDEGSHFANKVFSKLMSRYGIRHVMGLAYHPQSNEQVEISNREIKKILEKIVNISDSCHGRVSGINKICIPKFLLLQHNGLGSNTGMGFLRTNDLSEIKKW